ncbi:MAG TPA: hypothetical protein VE710_13900 [Candidatus Bathyarchaeia archaeon]|nr:hypothetical protein [Candidatus Bathyarchaeia archaeon]
MAGYNYIREFHLALAQTMQKMVNRYYQRDHSFMEHLQQVVQCLSRLPAPASASFVMFDMDATQFLTDGQRITGLVDTEGYVLAPKEFDFIGLEYVLDRQAAEDFRKGYETISPIPDLTPYRYPYRFFLRLLTAHGSKDLQQSLDIPVLF